MLDLQAYSEGQSREMIYLDHNATTPVLPAVVEAVLPYLREDWGNPSSAYRFGSKLRKVVETAREQVAGLLQARPTELIFTSGGTESNNTALHAISRAFPGKRHIITSVVEHTAVLSYCRYLETEAYRISYLPVDREGLLSLADLEAAITPETAGVSLMWANNETGVFFPIEKIAAICQRRGVLFHCDAVQAVGRLPINLSRLPIDYLSLSGHKFGAPKGIGGLYIRSTAPFSPLVYGGHQENGRRGGTESLSLIAGLGVAASHACQQLPTYSQKVRTLRDALETSILANTPNAFLNGHPTQRLPNTTNIHFSGSTSEVLLTLLDQAGVCASSGAACSAQSISPSHVLTAMKGHKVASESVRFSLGADLTPAQADAVSKTCSSAVSFSRCQLE